VAYVELTDIKDELLCDAITQEDLDEAIAYVDSFARKLGVTKIVSPIPYEVKQLAISYACMTRAKFKTSGTDPEKIPYSGKESSLTDSWGLKYKIYAAEVEKWKKEITPEVIQGGVMEAPRFNSVISLYRR